MKKFFTRKRVIWTIVFLLLIGGAGYYVRAKGNAPNGNIQSEAVKRIDLEQTVLATGQVTSDINLALSFLGSGIAQKIYVREGEVVKTGQVLATLDQSTANAALLSAQGALAQAKANYQRVISGSTKAQINVAQKAVEANQKAVANARKNYDSVKKQQETNVLNAYRTLVNGSLEAIQVVGPYTSPGVTSASAPTISGLYLGSEQGSYTISQSGNTFSVSGLEIMAAQKIDTRSVYALGNKGLYVQFPSDQISATWEISIPNDKAAGYVTNYNAYQSALAAEDYALTTAQNQIDAAENAMLQAQASLEQVQSGATSADLEVAKAQIQSAEGQVASAEVALGNTVLKAPASGTITNVDIKVGEQAVPSREVMVLQDVGELYAEANVSEANIASLKVGQQVDYTFDALGPDRHFKGKITTINPASTVVSGVVNYKVTADFEDVTEIRPGMTANMTVMVAQVGNALAVPNSAIINRADHQLVRVVDDLVKKTYHEVEVQTGLQADGGMVEVLSGLAEGQQVVTFVK